ncbi:hypothetical protein GGR57DRAFT_478828 [Xylariaceae sp. FL1272]|nr:hypothetical protein GGR57DRAFT_478828 [Xylariaceae sp. FL1272]
MRACIGILDAIITFGVLPGNKLQKCVQILSSIHCVVKDAQKEAWHTMGILFRSHNGQATVRVLLEILSGGKGTGDKKKEDVREIRGALSVLTKLVSKSSEKGYPLVPYCLLVDGLHKVTEAESPWKIYLDILRLVNALFCDARGRINTMLTDEDWIPILDIAVSCSAGVVTFLSKSNNTINTPDDSESPESLIAKELSKLVSRLEDVTKEPQGPVIQRQDCMRFFVKLNPALPDSAATLVLNYFQEFRCCFPSDAQWRANLDMVLDGFFKDRKRATIVRLQALRAVTEVYDLLELVDNEVEPDFVLSLVKRLLISVADETDIAVLQEIVSFAANVATTTSFPLFCHITDTLRSIVGSDQVRVATAASLSRKSSLAALTATLAAFKLANTQTPANVVTKGFVQIFLRVMDHDVAKAIRMFNSLISIAKLNTNEPDARVSAMRLLVRLRADWANRIFVTTHTETAQLATTLYRTERSFTRKVSEDASQQTRARTETGIPGRPMRGMSFTMAQTPDRSPANRASSGSKADASASSMLWMFPDIDALPEPPSTSASPVLYSSLDTSPEDISSEGQEALLPMGLWLETILHLIQNGCNWEVYSFILVHLPSQLSNHAVFSTAVPQIQELRRLLCEQIRQNTFQEPPAASILRKADVAICLFHSLTMILSYHRHFQKPDEDEIVATFVQGISTWERCAKCCIHALSICCHELPGSTSKALIVVLQRMAQVITQPNVAMHILEFLVGLSRLPALYINFRREEYQMVFGICFRYLQYVRGKKQSQSHRPNSMGDALHGRLSVVTDTALSNTGDDLPQYVYTLAYHVVIFWFLALKLADRAGHVSWIAKNLFTDVDGSQVIDEQAQTSLDFMQRVTYADINESLPDPLFTPDRFGEIIKRHWLIGNSIVTVEQAVISGWAQITKRQPSGTSSYTIRELFRAPPPHQQSMDIGGRDNNSASTNCVLPNHLFVQLLGPLPQYNDMSKPVPLPSNDAVEMAIRVFDRNSTVDGHKVGVIYIGENQTDELEILANVSGSSEYVEFVNGLGTLTKLKGATFNTQGLDRYTDQDGEYAFCWRDRVSELVFHVTTQMPTNLETDPQCISKKRHIGNDFVNIIFNDSGFPFKFDTFPSDFNYVNIVITPESRASFIATRQRTPKDVQDSFYKVQVMSKPGFPEISPASETKIVSLKALPDFIRLLAFNASVFSHVWANRESGEHLSSWGSRLREINRLRDKYAPKTGPSPSPPGTSHSHGNGGVVNGGGPQIDVSRPGSTVRDSLGSLSLRRSSVATFFSNSSEQNSHSHRSSLMSTNTALTEGTEVHVPTAVDHLVESLDFSRWA